MNEQIPSVSIGNPNSLAATISGNPGGVNANVSAQYPNALNKFVDGIAARAAMNAGYQNGQGFYSQPSAGLGYQNGNFNASVDRTLGRNPMTQANIGWSKQF